VSYQVSWEIRALDLTAGFLRDDPPGVAALGQSVSRLAEEPRPSESFAYRSPDLRRLRAGRYCVFYTIDNELQIIQIDHASRVPNRAGSRPPALASANVLSSGVCKRSL
jgi:mRNA interferase RelE/StbE